MSQKLRFGPEDLVREMVALDSRFDPKANFELFLEASYCQMALLTTPDRDRSRALASRHSRVLHRYGDRKAVVSRRICELFEMTARAIAGSEEDFLGKVFMLLGFGDRVASSPGAKALVTSLVLQQNFEERVREQDPLAMAQPDCGSGVIPMKAANLIRGMGHDPEKCFLVVAADSDARCFKMTFLQLALMRVPALVIHGDIAKRQEFDRAINRTAQRQCAWLGGTSSDALSMTLEEFAAMIEGAKAEAVQVPDAPAEPSTADSSSVEGTLQVGGDAEGVFNV